MNTKTVWQWLDAITAWSFVIGLCYCVFHLFFVQIPARDSGLGGEGRHSDIGGVIFVMLPYCACLMMSLGGKERLAGWPGGNIRWRMIVWLHTRLWFPTLLSYLMVWWHYEYAVAILKTDLINVFSHPMMVFISLMYLSNALKYIFQSEQNHDDK